MTLDDMFSGMTIMHGDALSDLVKTWNAYAKGLREENEQLQAELDSLRNSLNDGAYCPYCGERILEFRDEDDPHAP